MMLGRTLCHALNYSMPPLTLALLRTTEHNPEFVRTYQMLATLREGNQQRCTRYI